MSLETLALSLARLDQMMDGLESAVKRAEMRPKGSRRAVPQMDLFSTPVTPPLVSPPSLDVAEVSRRLETAILNIENVLKGNLKSTTEGKVSHG